MKYNPLFIRVLNEVYKVNKIRHRGINNIYINRGRLLNSNVDIKGNNNKIYIERNVRLSGCSFYLNGSNNLVYIYSGCSLKEVDFYIEDNNNEIIINEGTTIHGKTHLACIEGCKIKIGKDCMFSSDVTLRTGDSHSVIDFNGKRINISKDIIIGNHVWFGNKTMVQKGVHIADNSIIGAGSVVTKSFAPSNIVIAGNPAKIIKENINWLRKRI